MAIPGNAWAVPVSCISPVPEAFVCRGFGYGTWSAGEYDAGMFAAMHREPLALSPKCVQTPRCSILLPLTMPGTTAPMPAGNSVVGGRSSRSMKLASETPVAEQGSTISRSTPDRARGALRPSRPSPMPDRSPGNHGRVPRVRRGSRPWSCPGGSWPRAAALRHPNRPPRSRPWQATALRYPAPSAGS